jgi:hypothetical protein
MYGSIDDFRTASSLLDGNRLRLIAFEYRHVSLLQLLGEAIRSSIAAAANIDDIPRVITDGVDEDLIVSMVWAIR